MAKKLKKVAKKAKKVPKKAAAPQKSDSYLFQIGHTAYLIGDLIERQLSEDVKGNQKYEKLVEKAFSAMYALYQEAFADMVAADDEQMTRIMTGFLRGNAPLAESIVRQMRKAGVR